MSAAALTFPATGILSGSVTAESTVAVACTSQTSYSLELDPGRNPDTAGTRRMKGASGKLVSYGLFRDASRASPWGTGTQAASSVGTGSSQQFTVYGRVPPQSTPEPGTYSDTVVATVTY